MLEREAHRLQAEIIAGLLKTGANSRCIHYVLTVLLGHNLSWAQVAQRIRRHNEMVHKATRYKTDRPGLLRRCIAAYEVSCAYCGGGGTEELGPDGKVWELDRIVAGRFGGDYSPANIALCCHACNQKKLGNFVLPEMRVSSLEMLEARDAA